MIQDPYLAKLQVAVRVLDREAAMAQATTMSLNVALVSTRAFNWGDRIPWPMAFK